MANQTGPRLDKGFTKFCTFCFLVGSLAVIAFGTVLLNTSGGPAPGQAHIVVSNPGGTHYESGEKASYHSQGKLFLVVGIVACLGTLIFIGSEAEQGRPLVRLKRRT